MDGDDWWCVWMMKIGDVCGWWCVWMMMMIGGVCGLWCVWMMKTGGVCGW